MKNLTSLQRTALNAVRTHPLIRHTRGYWRYQHKTHVRNFHATIINSLVVAGLVEVVDDHVKPRRK